MHRMLQDSSCDINHEYLCGHVPYFFNIMYPILSNIDSQWGRRRRFGGWCTESNLKGTAETGNGSSKEQNWRDEENYGVLPKGFWWEQLKCVYSERKLVFSEPRWAVSLGHFPWYTFRICSWNHSFELSRNSKSSSWSPNSMTLFGPIKL